MRKLWMILLLSLLPVAAMAEIPDESAAAAMFSGYTLTKYSPGIDGSQATGYYIRIEESTLYRKQATFSAGSETQVMDDIPVPLTQAMADFILAGAVPPEGMHYAWLDFLLYPEGYNWYQAHYGWPEDMMPGDGIDRSRVPMEGRLLELDIQTNALVALTETEEGSRFLYIHTYDAVSNTYASRRTKPLPVDASLDIPHAGPGEIELYGAGWRCTYAAQPDGDYLLESVSGADSWCYVNFCGLESLETNRLQIGTVPGYDLFQADLPAIAGSIPEPDRSGWAVVSAAEGLPLYAHASKASESLGTFFSGTPVRVLEEAGAWLRVSIGTDGRLLGWMQRSGLTFGSAMDDVENRFPDLHYIEAFHGQRPLYTSADMTECVEASTQRYWMWVVGEVEEELYILLHRWGESGYVPKDWLFPGNG